MEHHISSTEGNWLQRLAEILDNAQDEDIVVVNSEAVQELAENALKRRSDHKHLRIMTEETFSRLS